MESADMDYKDSLIEWVGMIPSHWSVIPNKRIMHKEKRVCEKWNNEDVLSLTTTGVIIRDLLAGGKMPASFDGYQYVKKGELLMCLFDIDVTPRCVGRVENDGVTSPAYSAFVLNDTSDLNYYYYYYLMIDNSKELLHLAKNLRHSITEEQLGTLKVPCPPYCEQVEIGKYLDREIKKIDDLIHEATASVEEYKELKRAVIYEKVTKGLNENKQMKESGMEFSESIPEDWNVRRFVFSNSVRGRLGWKGLKADEYVDEGYPFLSAFNIIDDKLSWDGLNFITKERYDESPEIQLSVGDIVLVKDGAGIGKCARVDELPLGEATVNSSLAVITPCEGVYYKYEYYFFLSTVFQNIISRLKNGMGVPHLTQESMKEIYIPVPPLEEQKAIANYLDGRVAEIDGLIFEKQELIDELEAYKKSLIYETITGKRKVV